ncbi:ATP-dependent DNA ligase [Streptomyces sp. NBC_00645]
MEVGVDGARDIMSRWCHSARRHHVRTDLSPDDVARTTATE